VRWPMAMKHIPLKEFAPLIGVTIENWYADNAPRLGAALSFYMALSLAPALIIVLAVAGFAFGRQAAQGLLVSQIQGLVGYEGAKSIQTVIQGAHRTSTGVPATVLGLITLFFGASAVTIELRDDLNTIWKVPNDPAYGVGSILNLAKERLLSFTLVLGGGVFLLVSLMLNAWASAAARYVDSFVAPPQTLIRTVDSIVTFVVITILFAVIFKILPAVRLRWSDVAIGAVVTSLLFLVGKFLLGLYLGRAGFTDTYGAAGSLVIVLVWVYYSSQVLFLGAEFTKVYTFRFGSLSAATHD
jgi:membrane protein